MTRPTLVAVAGATGMLGSQIVEQLLARGATVRALVRPGSPADRRSRLSAFEGDQLTIVAADLHDPVDRLARALDGADVVVSAVQGGADVVTDGQINLLRAAERASVGRMVPSDFAVDLHRLDEGDNVFLDHRRHADAAFATSSVRPVHVLTGAFMEVMLAPFMEIVDLDAGTFSYWGDGDQPMDLTSVADTAAYAAAAALDPGLAGRTFRAAGTVVDMHGLRDAMQAAFDRPLEARRLGSADDLRAEIARRKAASPDPTTYVALQYQWAMITGKAKLEPLENDRFPDVRPTDLASFLRTAAGRGT